MYVDEPVRVGAGERRNNCEQRTIGTRRKEGNATRQKSVSTGIVRHSSRLMARRCKTTTREGVNVHVGEKYFECLKTSERKMSTGKKAVFAQ